MPFADGNDEGAIDPFALALKEMDVQLCHAVAFRLGLDHFFHNFIRHLFVFLRTSAQAIISCICTLYAHRSRHTFTYKAWACVHAEKCAEVCTPDLPVESLIQCLAVERHPPLVTTPPVVLILFRLLWLLLVLLCLYLHLCRHFLIIVLLLVVIILGRSNLHVFRLLFSKVLLRLAPLHELLRNTLVIVTP